MFRLGNIYGHISAGANLCESAHSRWLHSAVLFGDQATRTRTPKRYPNIELTSVCPILVTPSARLGSDNYHFSKSVIWLSWDSNSWPSASEACALPMSPPHPVPMLHITWAIYIYIKSSFPKRVKHHARKMALPCLCQVWLLSFRKGPFTYEYMRIYQYIFMKSSFPEHDLRTWHGHCNLDFWIGA